MKAFEVVLAPNTNHAKEILAIVPASTLATTSQHEVTVVVLEQDGFEGDSIVLATSKCVQGKLKALTDRFPLTQAACEAVIHLQTMDAHEMVYHCSTVHSHLRLAALHGTALERSEAAGFQVLRGLVILQHLGAARGGKVARPEIVLRRLFDGDVPNRLHFCSARGAIPALWLLRARIAKEMPVWALRRRCERVKRVQGACGCVAGKRTCFTGGKAVLKHTGHSRSARRASSAAAPSLLRFFDTLGGMALSVLRAARCVGGTRRSLLNCFLFFLGNPRSKEGSMANFGLLMLQAVAFGAAAAFEVPSAMHMTQLIGRHTWITPRRPPSALLPCRRALPRRTRGCGPRLVMGLLEDMRAANAERMAINEGKNLIGSKYGVKGLQAFPCDIMRVDWKADKLAGMLQDNGCLGLQKVLSQETSDALLAYINADSDRAKAAVLSGDLEFDKKFGGVNCRGKGTFGLRQDQWLPMEGIVADAAKEAMENLAPLLQRTVTSDGTMHELSCLVADPGAPRQCIHADTIVLPCPQYPKASMEPLYTFFIALQDVEDNMGHTTFIPRTHTPDAHLLWNLGQKQKDSLIASLPAVTSALKTGDVAIFDSRVLHCGDANSSAQRRVLFYFTLSQQAEWPLPDGLHGSNSILAADKGKWKISDICVRETV